MALSRVLFFFYNHEAFGHIPASELSSILKGSFIFDSGSIFYINLLFVFLSLIPFYFRNKHSYQRMLATLFLVTNGAALLLNLADTFFYEYKLARITWGESSYFAEENIGRLMLSFLIEYWWGLLIWIGSLWLLWFLGFRKVTVDPKRRLLQSKPLFYISQSVVCAAMCGFGVFAIRGFTLSAASFPITVSDAALYVKPKYSSLILSNPFCLIRTFGIEAAPVRYMSDEEAETLFSPQRRPQKTPSPYADTLRHRIGENPNIVTIVLESFGVSHIKALSGEFGADDPSYTPFIDSLIGEGLIFTNAYQSGLRSIDAMPAVWASIPSFKTHFLSLPNSVSLYEGLPALLKKRGYTSEFLHGAVSTSMSFVAFGEMSGIERFVSREDYEAAYGTNDFDGKWGIWDHKFFPFAVEEINKLPQPFYATLFTLSSHHPFGLPEDIDPARFPDGRLPIHRTIRYSDWALSEFFRKASHQPWYRNTIFILLADHTSGAVTEKYNSVPYNKQIPILIYTPSGIFRGTNDRIVSQADIMPTLLHLLGSDAPYFAFGSDMFSAESHAPVVFYADNAFDMVTDSLLYVLSDDGPVGVYDYKNDYRQQHNLLDETRHAEAFRRMEAYVQQYYKALSDRKYTPGDLQK